MFFWLSVFCYATKSAISIGLMDRFRDAFDISTGVIAESKKKGEELEKKKWELLFQIFPSYETFLRAQGRISASRQKEIMAALCGSENAEDPSKCWKKQTNQKSNLGFMDLSIWNGEVMIPLLAVMIIFGSQISLTSCAPVDLGLRECTFGRAPGSICLNGCFASEEKTSYKHHASVDIALCSRLGTWLGSSNCKIEIPIQGCYSDAIHGIRLKVPLGNSYDRYEDAIDACDATPVCDGVGVNSNSNHMLFKMSTAENAVIRDPSFLFYFKGGCANSMRRFRNDASSISQSKQ
jgi:hypothetical protein